MFNHHLTVWAKRNESVERGSQTFLISFFFFTQADALSLSPAHAFNQLFRQKTKVCSHPWIMEGEKAQRRMEVRNRGVQWQEVSPAQIFLYDSQPWTCCRQANVEELTGVSRRIYIDQANTYINIRTKIRRVFDQKQLIFCFKGVLFVSTDWLLLWIRVWPSHGLWRSPVLSWLKFSKKREFHLKQKHYDHKFF